MTVATTVARTGLTEREARKEGYDIVVCNNIKPDKPSYSHGREMFIKAIADKETERLLGVQFIGYKGVNKRIDIFDNINFYLITKFKIAINRYVSIYYSSSNIIHFGNYKLLFHKKMK